KAVQPKTQRAADAEIGALFQVSREPVASRVEMGVRVDDHGHYGLAGEAHTRRTGGGANVGRRGRLRESCAPHHHSRVLDYTSVAHDQPRPFVRRNGLCGRWDCKSAKETKGNDCRNCGHIHSMHGNLLHKKICVLTVKILVPSVERRATNTG